MENKKGFAHIVIILVVLVSIGIVGYFTLTRSDRTNDQASNSKSSDAEEINYDINPPADLTYEECIKDSKYQVNGIYPTFCTDGKSFRLAGDYSHGSIEELGEFKKFTNDHYHYSFEFPHAWRVQEDEMQPGIPVVTVFEPCEDQWITYNVWDCVNTRFYSVGPKYDPSKSLKEYSYAVSIRDNAFIIEEKSIELNGRDAYYAKNAFQQSHGGYEPMIEVVTILGDQIFRIEHREEFVSEDYDDTSEIPFMTESVFNQILSTFEFID